MKNRLPEVINLGRIVNSSVDWYIQNYNSHVEREIAGRTDPDMCEETRYICGYPIPLFQREAVWGESSKVAFIESVYMGLPIGTLTIHDIDWERDEPIPLRMSGWLIDGQQRLRAIEEYIHSKFKVFDLYYLELTNREQKQFKQTPLNHYRVAIWDESKIKDLYNRMNFGGVAHTSNEKAI